MKINNKIKEIEKGCGKEMEQYSFCLNCNKEVNLKDIGYPISGSEWVCEKCGEHDKDPLCFLNEKGFEFRYKVCKKGFLCSICKSKLKLLKQFQKDIRELHGELKGKVRKETLRKNEGRNSYFLELNNNEIMEIIDKTFKKGFGEIK